MGYHDDGSWPDEYFDDEDSGGQVRTDLFSEFFAKRNLSVHFDGTPIPLFAVPGERPIHYDLKEGNVDTRTDRFPAEGGLPILASAPGYARIPFTSPLLTMIGITPFTDDVSIAYAKTVEEKRALTFSHETILVAWPGRQSQDIFIIDDMNAARRALGMKMAGEDTLVDKQGNEWTVAE